MTKKTYSSAPLPFMGQKRNFLKHFKEALKDYPEDAIYVDLFGGSGLLAHTTKSVYPKATVIYNDYDNFQKRIKNISKTNKLLAKLRYILKDFPKKERVQGELKQRVLECVKSEKGYVDYTTLSSSLLFSMNYVDSFEALLKSTLYNKITLKNYDATGYLNDLTIVSTDYKKLFDKYDGIDNVIYLIDPPYLSTETSHYKNYWKLTDYLGVLDILNGKGYFYFTSNKSSIIELCEWIECKTPNSNPFKGAVQIGMSKNASYNATYTDIMIHKNWTQTIS